MAFRSALPLTRVLRLSQRAPCAAPASHAARDWAGLDALARAPARSVWGAAAPPGSAAAPLVWRAPTRRSSTQQGQSARQVFADRRLLCWSQEQIYEVVADINSYTEFLPWVLQSKVLTETESELTAELEVGFASIREKYVSRVTMESPHTIKAVAEDMSLFKELTYVWQFVPGPSKDGPTTYVAVEVAYEFQNPLYGMVASAAYEKVARRMIQAFEDRAVFMYGR